MHSVALLDRHLGSAEEIKRSEELSKFDGVNVVLERRGQLNLDVSRSFRQDNLDCVVLGQALVVGMHVVDLKSVKRAVLHVLVKVVLAWHVVALVPVCLPLSKDWEARLDVEVNVVFESLGS